MSDKELKAKIKRNGKIQVGDYVTCKGEVEHRYGITTPGVELVVLKIAGSKMTAQITDRTHEYSGHEFNLVISNFELI